MKSQFNTAQYSSLYRETIPHNFQSLTVSTPAMASSRTPDRQLPIHYQIFPQQENTTEPSYKHMRTSYRIKTADQKINRRRIQSDTLPQQNHPHSVKEIKPSKASNCEQQDFQNSIATGMTTTKNQTKNLRNMQTFLRSATIKTQFQSQLNQQGFKTSRPSLQSNLIELQSTIQSSDKEQPTLKESKIKQLERQLKQQKLQIYQLQQTDLKQRVLLDQNRHNCNQDVYISDLQSELEQQQLECKQLRQDLQIKDRELALLSSNYDKLNSVVRVYRGQATPNKIMKNELSEEVVFVQNNNNDGFLEISQQIRLLMKSKTLVDLFVQARSSIIKLLKASKVDFLLMDRDLINYYHKVGGKTQKLQHAHYRFEVVIDSNKEELVQPQFKNLIDVQRGFVCQGKHCVWPVTSKKINLFFIQITKSSGISFDKTKDSKFINELAQIINRIYQNLVLRDLGRVKEDRAIYILDTFKHLLADRKHVSICKWVQDKFPKIFNFEACGLLFMDPVQSELFKIQFLDQHEQPQLSQSDGKEYDCIIKFPMNIGVTSLAIQTQETVYFNRGLKLPQFLNEVDNCNGRMVVESLLVTPIIDSATGQLWGVLQLVNKRDGDKICNQDVIEVGALMPTLAEIIKTAEHLRTFTNVSSAVQLQLFQMKDSMFDNIKKLDETKVEQITDSIRKVKDLTSELCEQKNQTIFSEKNNKMTKEIFGLIKEAKDRDRKGK